uniref:C2H2-type domain-containing protein n=1 Tax=Ditylenchus dipsaci TaxID=166011 RepID=A0A915DL58_9BILA
MSFNAGWHFSCCLCQLTHLSLDALEFHVGTDHFSYNPFQCELCADKERVQNLLLKQPSRCITSMNMPLNDIP